MQTAALVSDHHRIRDLHLCVNSYMQDCGDELQAITFVSYSLVSSIKSKTVHNHNLQFTIPKSHYLIIFNKTLFFYLKRNICNYGK